LTNALSTINASIVEIILLTSDRYQQIETSSSLARVLSTITRHFDEFTKEIHQNRQRIHDGLHFVEQVLRLCAIFDDFFVCLQSFVNNDYDATIKQNLLVISNRIGEIHQDFIRRLTNNDFNDYQDKFLVLAKSVANTTALYVLKAKELASRVQEQTLVNDIIFKATQCALATSQLVACTKVNNNIIIGSFTLTTTVC
jgi:talin